MSQFDHEEVQELTLPQAAPITTSRNEQERIVAAWQASGQTQCAFARELGIPANRLWYWIKRARERDAAAESTVNFTECRLPSGGSGTADSHVLRLGGDGGRDVTLTLSADVTPRFVATLLREIVQ